MVRCQARVTYESQKKFFADGKHYFYPEYQCEKSVEDEGEGSERKLLCKGCRVKSDKSKTQEARCFDHGLIGGPFTEKSHIVGSPWYERAVAQYGKPKELLESSNSLEDEPSEVIEMKRTVIQRRIKKALRIGTATAALTSQTISLTDLKTYEQFDDPLPVEHVERETLRTEMCDGSMVEIDSAGNIFQTVEGVRKIIS